MEREGAGSVLKRAGYCAPIRVEAFRIKWLNAGPPAMKNVFSIALEPTSQDRSAGIVALYLDLRATDAVEPCRAY